MTPSIFDDALARPELFDWFGIDGREFKVWLVALPQRVHPGVVSFWERTGGGDVFESETLLGPLIETPGDSVDEMCSVHWSRGL